MPNVVVSCTRSEKNWSESPVLICEIPSPSTARLDATTKLDSYRELPSVGEIFVLRSTKRHVTLWRRSDRQWVVEDFIGSALVPLAATTTPVPLDDLYAPLDFDEPDASADPA